MSEQEGQLPSEAELKQRLAGLLADVQARVRDDLQNMPRNGTPSRASAWGAYRRLAELTEKLTSALEDFA